MENDKIISFTLEETNETIEFEVLDQVIYNQTKYLLVVETDLEDEEEAEGVILKQVNDEGDDIVYDLIEDEQEYMMVLELLRENSDDLDLDYVKED